MPSQTITLAASDLFRDTSSQKQWRVSVQLDADFEPGPTDRYFRRLIVRNDQGPSNFQYQMSFDETGVAPNTETASQLVDEWAEADVALTFAQGSNTLDVSGPNNADNEVQDATDNYTWSPPVNHVPFAGDFFFSLFDSSADLTITFKFPDPPPPPPPPPPPAVVAYTLEVDWDNDGTYANANADVWPQVRQGTFKCWRGRNFASQRIGLSIAGTLSVDLDNRDGLYDPQNPNGALFGLLAGGRRIRWRMADSGGTLVTQWTGWLDELRGVDAQSGLDRVQTAGPGCPVPAERPRHGQSANQHPNPGRSPAAFRPGRKHRQRGRRGGRRGLLGGPVWRGPRDGPVVGLRPAPVKVLAGTGRDGGRLSVRVQGRLPGDGRLHPAVAAHRLGPR